MRAAFRVGSLYECRVIRPERMVRHFPPPDFRTNWAVNDLAGGVPDRVGRWQPATADQKNARLVYTEPFGRTYHGNPDQIAGFIMTTQIAQKTSRRVFSLHGIRTRGVWQKDVTPILANAGFIPEPFDFGYFRAVQLIWPPSRRKKVENFLSDYIRECNRLDGGTPSLLAHSYGTYISAQAMLKYPEIKFDRMVLCGAILRREFPWDRLANNGQVNDVLNQYGGQDFWAWVVAWVVSDAGQSGRYGFFPATCLTQQWYPSFRHGDYFYDLNYEQNWLPFLKGENVGKSPIEEATTPNWRFRSVIVAILLTLAGLAYYFGGRPLTPSQRSDFSQELVLARWLRQSGRPEQALEEYRKAQAIDNTREIREAIKEMETHKQ